MPGTIVVVGYGPGISQAVAEKFGAEGFSVALIGRQAERITGAADRLGEKGVKVAGFTADASDPASIRDVIGRARRELGPIEAIHWNAIGGTAAPDLIGADDADLRGVFDVAVFGLLSAVEAALPDLEKAPNGAVLVTNGAYGDVSTPMDAFAVRAGAMGLALANAAKHKLVGLLSERLKDKGVFVGEVVVAGAVKGTASDNGSVPTIEGATIADAFWRLYQQRREIRARVG